MISTTLPWGLSWTLSLTGRTKDIVNVNNTKFALSKIQSALKQVLPHHVIHLVTFASRAAHTEQVIVAYLPEKVNVELHGIFEINDSAARICQPQGEASPTIFARSEASVPLLPTWSFWTRLNAAKSEGRQGVSLWTLRYIHGY